MDMTQKNSYTILYQNLATFTMLPQKKCVRNERIYIKFKKISRRVTNLTLRRVHRNAYPSECQTLK
jgi:hypothetical protein